MYEDNNACFVQATTNTTYKPRTKHISLKYHHFNDQVKSGSLTIVKVNTSENMVDIFTKPLEKQKFQYLRHLLMGW